MINAYLKQIIISSSKSYVDYNLAPGISESKDYRLIMNAPPELR